MIKYAILLLNEVLRVNEVFIAKYILYLCIYRYFIFNKILLNYAYLNNYLNICVKYILYMCTL